jgi:MinD-like ATPase involved in chromosome partitioning or flagellar assembly
MDAYVVLKILKAYSYNGYKTVIINKCTSDHEGRNTFVNLNSASLNFLNEELNLLGVVDYNKEFIRSVIDQIPFVNKYCNTNINTNNSRSFNQISRLADALVEIQQMANIHQSY